MQGKYAGIAPVRRVSGVERQCDGHVLLRSRDVAVLESRDRKVVVVVRQHALVRHLRRRLQPEDRIPGHVHRVAVATDAYPGIDVVVAEDRAAGFVPGQGFAEFLRVGVQPRFTCQRQEQQGEGEAVGLAGRIDLLDGIRRGFLVGDAETLGGQCEGNQPLQSQCR
jgi:hypothetical protein